MRELIRQNRRSQPDRLDTSTQPGHPGLGELPPSHRGVADVQAGGMGFVAGTLAMGQTQTPWQVAPLDRQQILASAGTACLAVCGGHRRTDAGGETRLAAVGEPDRNQNPAARQGQGGCQSVRPALARLF